MIFKKKSKVPEYYVIKKFQSSRLCQKHAFILIFNIHYYSDKENMNLTFTHYTSKKDNFFDSDYSLIPL